MDKDKEEVKLLHSCLCRYFTLGELKNKEVEGQPFFKFKQMTVVPKTTIFSEDIAAAQESIKISHPILAGEEQRKLGTKEASLHPPKLHIFLQLSTTKHDCIRALQLHNNEYQIFLPFSARISKLWS